MVYDDLRQYRFIIQHIWKKNKGYRDFLGNNGNMTTVTAIICEYNPFHLGHAAQIAHIRKKDPETVILALMSGSFVQRGTPALFPKYDRARGAVLSGADLVLELPFPFCMAPAERFASAGVSLLHSLGGVDRLFFGSESGDLSALCLTAERMGSTEYRAALADAAMKARHSSLSHPRLAEEVYVSLYGEGYPVTPNDILAVEYLRALDRFHAKTVPETEKRVPGYSASAAREAIRQDDGSLSRLIPPETLALLRSVPTADERRLESAVLSFYRLADPASLRSLPGYVPGLEYRLTGAADEAENLSDFYARLRTKKETDASLRRIVYYGLVGVTGDLLAGLPRYTTLLAANEKGCAVLKELKKTALLPILTRPAEGKRLTGGAAVQFEAAVRADKLFSLAKSSDRTENPFRKTPYIEGERT